MDEEPRSLYECRRWDDWKYNWLGALLIMARDKKEAKRLFEEAEDEPPCEIIELDISKVGIIYDDKGR